MSALAAVRPYNTARDQGRRQFARVTRPGWTTAVGAAAALLLIVPLLTLKAEARGGGGHGGGFGGHGGMSFAGRGGGFGGGRAMGMSRIGGPGIGARSVGVSRIGGPGIGARSIGMSRIGGPGIGTRSFGGARIDGVAGRSVGGSRFVGRSFGPQRGGVAAARLPGGNRFTTASARTIDGPGGFSRTANLGRVHGLFGNRAIANAAWRPHFASARFHGRFFGSPWPWWRGGLVIGWIGPVFWPYAYYDLFDYVYWPYAYDDFWPYAYDDIYYGIYGNYAYGGPGAVARDHGAGSAARHSARAGGEQRAADVCSNKASELTDWPIERISEIVQPTDAQRPALDELKAASAQAIDILKAACPKDLPTIPTGRLAAMASRLEVMLQAVQTVRPALDRFYQSLSDEQKARFNAIAPGDSSTVAGQDQRDLSKFCDERAPGVTDLPIDRIAQAVRPTAAQQASLVELKDASAKAADGLKANCPTYQTLTPTGRVEAMEKRLAATLGAVKAVQPALTKFYDALSDEQKARFNALRSASRPQG
jgi:LTXXQ motif family protein